MVDPSNELTLAFLTLSLSAKGAAALWLVIPVSLIMAAMSWWIVAMSLRLLKR
jgi:hypothetical protein